MPSFAEHTSEAGIPFEQARDHLDTITGAIEAHPSPVGVVWGDQDPVAVHAMAERFVHRRPGTVLTTLRGVGHYPMIEAPGPFADAVLAHLADQVVAPPADG